MFQVTFSAPCFLTKTTLKVVNSKTVGLIFWYLWCWKVLKFAYVIWVRTLFSSFGWRYHLINAVTYLLRQPIYIAVSRMMANIRLQVDESSLYIVVVLQAVSDGSVYNGKPLTMAWQSADGVLSPKIIVPPRSSVSQMRTSVSSKSQSSSTSAAGDESQSHEASISKLLDVCVLFRT